MAIRFACEPGTDTSSEALILMMVTGHPGLVLRGSALHPIAEFERKAHQRLYRPEYCKHEREGLQRGTLRDQKRNDTAGVNR